MEVVIKAASQITLSAGASSTIELIVTENTRSNHNNKIGNLTGIFNLQGQALKLNQI
jgi:hypothetical protein